jgi:hypothetical protein
MTLDVPDQRIAQIAKPSSDVQRIAPSARDARSRGHFSRPVEPMRRRVPVVAVSLSALLLTIACSDYSPTGIVEGALMTVGEQVVIEAALDRVADTMQVRGRTAQDTLMANFTRIAARLVRLQGRQGEITVASPIAGAASIVMKAAAFIGIDASSAGSPNVHLLVAWSGLDDLHGTVQRALVVMADDPQREGTFSVAATSTTDAARYVDFGTGGGFYFNVSGTLSVATPQFSGGCAGLPDTQEYTCEVGRQSVGGTVTVSKDNGVTRPVMAITSAVLPAFRLTTKTLVLPAAASRR